jgi:hypothetical protein
MDVEIISVDSSTRNEVENVWLVFGGKEQLQTVFLFPPELKTDEPLQHQPGNKIFLISHTKKQGFG